MPTPKPLTRIDTTAGTFEISEACNASGVFEIFRPGTGCFVGLVRQTGGGWRGKGLDGFETFEHRAAAIVAVARRKEVLG